MTLKKALERASAVLKEKNIETPVKEAGVLLAFALSDQKDISWLYAHPNDELTPAQLERYDQLVLKRSNGMPFQYISNQQEFMSLNFYVDSNCLIPRADTEILVEAALLWVQHKIKGGETCPLDPLPLAPQTQTTGVTGGETCPLDPLPIAPQMQTTGATGGETCPLDPLPLAPQTQTTDVTGGETCHLDATVAGNDYFSVDESLIETNHSESSQPFQSRASHSLRVLDIGTGSGAIAVSIAHYLKDAFVDAMDLSTDALKIAEGNAKRHQVQERIRFINADFLQWRAENPYDIVLSNPPYIPRDDLGTLMCGVRDFEPHMALDGGEDGLDFYRAISSKIPEVLIPGGAVFVEVGLGQAEDVKKMFEKQGLTVRIYKDLAGIDRVVGGEKKK